MTDPQKSSRLPMILGIVAVVVLLAGGAVYWFVLRDDAPPAPELGSDCDVVGDSTSADGDWEVVAGEDVYVGYRIQELFGGETIKKDAVGRTPAVTGTMTIEGGSVESVTIEADLSELASDQGRRDQYMNANGLQTDEFPDTSFETTGVTDLPTDPVAGTTVDATVTGDLTLHGETREVAVPVKACWAGDTIVVTGAAPITLADYSIDTPNVGGFVAVDDAGELELSLTFERS